MSERRYNTKQRELILDYLQKTKSEHKTAEEIYDYFKLSDNPIGRTTIYRYMEKLINEGAVRKFFSDDNTSACFQFVDDEKECKLHYHLKCSVCNRLLHLECESIDQLSRHIKAEHEFSVDMTKTVIYGVCGNCK